MVLEIRDACRSDAGSYTCRIRNVRGAADATVDITVVGQWLFITVHLTVGLSDACLYVARCFFFSNWMKYYNFVDAIFAIARR